MADLEKIRSLISRFGENLQLYKNNKNHYNEHSCRIEYIDPLLKLLGWDVANESGVAPQYREVIAEDYSTDTDRPDYSMTLRGVTKFFVEAKKPDVDISQKAGPAYQARKYGWNAKHSLVVLTNFEYLVIYDTSYPPSEDDSCVVARYRIYHYTEYVEKFDEIFQIISRDAVYSGAFDKYIADYFPSAGGQSQQVDEYFLSQINSWRVGLSNELYQKGSRYQSLEVLNDVVQEFINQIVFLRICEDKNLPLYHSLKDTVSNSEQLQNELEKLLRAADCRYNSGLFSGEDIIFDLSSSTISKIISALYYPQSPYLFSIIEPNMLGKIYEMFLTEQLIVLEDGTVGLGKKKDCRDRSVVSTPTEIVKYMVERVLSLACAGKSPKEILTLRIADISCGSGVFLEEAFEFLENYCVQWYLDAGQQNHLLEIGNGRYKLPLREKKEILSSCIYGIDIDPHAVEVAKFSLLIKLIEDETAPSVSTEYPILPDLDKNVLYGNSVISRKELEGLEVSRNDLIEIAPFDWDSINNGENFDVILGNPPYVKTEEMLTLLPAAEFIAYKKSYRTPHKQFDKYFIFIEQAIRKVKTDGYVCYIIPNKFFKIGAGEKLRELIAVRQMLMRLDDFGDAQLFTDRTVYSSIVLLKNAAQETFTYSNISSANELWAGGTSNSIELKSTVLNKLPWRLSTDMEFLKLLQSLDEVAVPITNFVEFFNGIQTSAERPTPIYWFTQSDVISESDDTVEIKRDGKIYTIEKAILHPYFKPTKKTEKGLNSYILLETNKRIIFPYDSNGQLISIDEMRSHYPGTLTYLEAYYDRLLPRSLSPLGVRDVPTATPDTWYQYGRTQALTSFINTPKLIVGVLSKEPMYVLDCSDLLIASGGTAGYVAAKQKSGSPYALEYIQAWLSHPITERIIEITGSDFEGGFIARGTFVLSTLPFVELNLNNEVEKAIYERVVSTSREIYQINDELGTHPAKRIEAQLLAQKNTLIAEIQRLIERVYRLEY